jgi:PAS domain S-box-containing protein
MSLSIETGVVEDARSGTTSVVAGHRPTWLEADRSAALRSYDILDTPREQDFDDLARIAAEVCGTPIAIVNFLDTDRQFFKAEVGVGNRPAPPLDLAFCGHALIEDDILVVEDATGDERFECNPLVIEDPRLRFYAGALIRTEDGFPIGTICVFDVVPRRLERHQLDTLKLLARQAMTQIELRKSVATQKRIAAEARAAEARHRQIFDSAVDFAVVTLDLQGLVTSWSAGARHILEWSEDEMLGKPADVFYTPEDKDEDLACREMNDARMLGRGTDERWHIRKSGERFWASGEIMPLRDDFDRHVGYVKILRDRTAQRLASQQKEDLSRELVHRMKNTLSIVQAIATQSFRTARSLDEGRDAISGRLAALARAQDVLTQTSWESAGIRRIVEGALAPHMSGELRIAFDGPDIVLPAQQGLGLSLALHELCVNAAKYGSLSTADGRVDIAWNVPEPGRFVFGWTESGGPAVTPPERTGFGSRLVERIVASYFSGKANLVFDPDGVRFHLEGSIQNA